MNRRALFRLAARGIAAAALAPLARFYPSGDSLECLEYARRREQLEIARTIEQSMQLYMPMNLRQLHEAGVRLRFDDRRLTVVLPDRGGRVPKTMRS